MIVLIDNYDSFTYNLVHYFGQLGQELSVYRNNQISVEKILNRKPKAIIISPGPCSPSEAGICVPLIQQVNPTIPIFGVCLGHQSLAAAFGAQIIRAPKPIHGKVKKVRHNGDLIFQHIPEIFDVTRYHSLIIDPDSLPDCFHIIATSDEPDEDQMIMAIAHKNYPFYGVQFHPESIRTEYGLQIIKNFIQIID